MQKRDLSDRLNGVTNQVLGCALEVHRRLGPGFLESVYEAAMAIELSRRSLPFRRQVPASVHYRGCRLGDARIDLIVQEAVVVELKAVESLLRVHRAQVISYLRILRLQVGLLINFNVALLARGIQRVVLSDTRR